MITKVYAHILDEDRKITAQKFESSGFVFGCTYLYDSKMPQALKYIGLRHRRQRPRRDSNPRPHA